MKKNIFIMVMLLLLVVAIIGCKENIQDNNSQKSTDPIIKNPLKANENVWMKIDEIQCLENPWEADWIEKNVNRYETIDNVKDAYFVQIQERIITKYYAEKGITIIDLKRTDEGEALCNECSCPSGRVLRVYVSSSDAEKLKELGFKESD